MLTACHLLWPFRTSLGRTGMAGISNGPFKPVNLKCQLQTLFFFKDNVNSLSSSYMWSLPSTQNWSIIVTEYFPGGYSSMTVLFKIVKVIWNTRNNLLSKFSWLKRVNEYSESCLYVNIVQCHVANQLMIQSFI